MARTYLIFSLPDLVTNSFLHPICIYLRTQEITHPLAQAFLVGTLLHLPFNYILIMSLCLGVTGVVAAFAVSNFSILLSFVGRVLLSGVHHPTCSSNPLSSFICSLPP
ncbi:hypothetical protein HN51_063438 [Arachis hypogaea]